MMKKKIWIPITIVVALLAVLLIVLFFFIKKDNNEQTFYAKVIEINDTSVLVEPIEGEPERTNNAKISFNITKLEKIGAKVGDVVQITYSGYVMLSYPAQITAISWEKASDCEQDDSLKDYKPVIYLYPEKETQVSVNLTLDGRLTCTYPKYGKGWEVTAFPDGTLIDNKGKTYNYLYWEGETFAQYDLSKGFCIKGENTATFLEAALEKLGLTRREANEFIVYWLPLMEQNPYNIISFQGEIYTDAAQLDVTPAPDTLIRVFMAWQKSDEFVEIPQQEFTAPERKGFTVVEWGGTEIKIKS